MKCDREKVTEIQHYQRIYYVKRHSDHERPLLSLACKVPEEHEYRGDEAVNDEIERKSGLPGLSCEPIYKLGYAQSEDEADMGPTHREHRVHHGQHCDRDKPTRTGSYHALGAKLLFDDIGDGWLRRAAKPQSRTGHSSSKEYAFAWGSG